MTLKFIWLIPFLLMVLSNDLFAQDQYSLEKVGRVKGVPWGLVFIDNGRAFISTREGEGFILNIESGSLDPVSGFPSVFARGQGGLLDVSIQPNSVSTLKNTHKLYFTYSKATKNGSATTLATANLVGNVLKDWTDLIITQSTTDTTRHYGSRITFDDTGHLFFSVGDRGIRSNGQDLTTHAGSILRLTIDGHTPSDNPELGENTLPEIWSYGHRNPQGLFFDVQSNTLWSVEHGPRGGDEINVIKKGQNYGWPVTSHGKEYWGPISVGESKEKKGIESPKKVYIPSIAPSSLIFYRGKHYPALNGKILIGALKLTHINVVDPKTFSEIRLFKDLGERIRAIAISPTQHLYFSTDNGNIFRVNLSN